MKGEKVTANYRVAKFDDTLWFVDYVDGGAQTSQPFETKASALAYAFHRQDQDDAFMAKSNMPIQTDEYNGWANKNWISPELFELVQSGRFDTVEYDQMHVSECSHIADQATIYAEPCIENGTSNCDVSNCSPDRAYCQRCDSAKTHFGSVFLHMIPLEGEGGRECIADFATVEQAEIFARAIAKIYRLEL